MNDHGLECFLLEFQLIQIAHLFSHSFSRKIQLLYSGYFLIQYGISNSTLTGMRKEMPIETSTIEKFCPILDCKVEEIIQYIPEEKNKNPILNLFFHPLK